MGARSIKNVTPEYLSTGTIAAKIDRCTETVRREIKSGRMKAVMFNGNYFVEVPWFEEWKAKYFKPAGVDV
jgi:IS30 family transposase